MKKVWQTNNRKVFGFRFVNKVCKLESQAMSSEFELLEKGLFGVNEKLLTQHISGPVTKYKLL